MLLFVENIDKLSIYYFNKMQIININQKNF